MSIIGKSLTSSNKGLMPEIEVTAPAGSLLTCVCGSVSYSYTLGASETIHVFKVDSGVWRITATKGSDSAYKDVTVSETTIYKIELFYVYGTINVITKETASVIATSGTTMVEGKWSSSAGNWVIGVPSNGTWVVSASYNGVTKTEDVEINTKEQVVSISIAFETQILTGGTWNVTVNGASAMNVSTKSGKTCRGAYNGWTTINRGEIVGNTITLSVYCESSTSAGIQVGLSSYNYIGGTTTFVENKIFRPNSAGTWATKTLTFSNNFDDYYIVFKGTSETYSIGFTDVTSYYS